MTRRIYGLANSKSVYAVFCTITESPNLSVTDLAKKFKTVPSVISEQLIPLKEHGLVIEKKQGKFRYFSTDKQAFRKLFELNLNKADIKKFSSFVEMLAEKKSIMAAATFSGLETINKMVAKKL